MEFKKTWKYHLLVILAVITFDLLGKYVQNDKPYFLELFKAPGVYYFYTFNIVYFITYFINFYLVSPLTLSHKKINKFIIGVFLLFVLFAVLRYLFEEIILFKIISRHNYGDFSLNNIQYYFFDNLYFAIKPILFSTLLYLFFLYAENKNKIHQLEIDHKKAEVDYLKSQISPHFLFNTLNAFYVELIDDKPETAKDIHKLSNLLRYVTYESQEDFVPLKNEIKFLEDYVYFYYKRFESELYVDFKVNGFIAHQQIPSLVLIHFIENVFKHGVINDKNNPAIIHINILDNYLELNTKNKFVTSEKYTVNGVGSTNVKRRLTAHFKNNFTLNYSNKNDVYTTYLKIPL